MRTRASHSLVSPNSFVRPASGPSDRLRSVGRVSRSGPVLRLVVETSVIAATWPPLLLRLGSSLQVARFPNVPTSAHCMTFHMQEPSTNEEASHPAEIKSPIRCEAYVVHSPRRWGRDSLGVAELTAIEGGDILCSRGDSRPPSGRDFSLISLGVQPQTV